MNSFYGRQYPLYVPPSHLEDIKVKTITTTRTTTMETEQHTKTLVIFGATGDLCRRKLIPALETLDKKGLLPDNFKIFRRIFSSNVEALEKIQTTLGQELTDAEIAEQDLLSNE